MSVLAQVPQVAELTVMGLCVRAFQDGTRKQGTGGGGGRIKAQAVTANNGLLEPH